MPVAAQRLVHKLDLDQVLLSWRNKAVEMNTANQGVGEDPSYCICFARLHFYGEQGTLHVHALASTLNLEF